jgi:hypothetical protein
MNNPLMTPAALQVGIERAAVRMNRKLINHRRYTRRYQRIGRLRREKIYRHWMRSKPASIRQLESRFPIGSTVMIRGMIHYLYGYNESNMLMFSHINPCVDYDLGCNTIKYICAEHLIRK